MYQSQFFILSLQKIVENLAATDLKQNQRLNADDKLIAKNADLVAANEEAIKPLQEAKDEFDEEIATNSQSIKDAQVKMTFPICHHQYVFHASRTNWKPMLSLLKTSMNFCVCLEKLTGHGQHRPTLLQKLLEKSCLAGPKREINLFELLV